MAMGSIEELMDTAGITEAATENGAAPRSEEGPVIEPTPAKIVEAQDLIADYFAPRFGCWAYRTFDMINTTFFDNKLPRPLIQWAITSYGKCLGFTSMWLGAPERPIITMHPSLLSPYRDPRKMPAHGPWGFDWDWFGPRFALDTLLHEAIHVAQGTIHREMPKGESSHNCKSWIYEVNRLAPLLGMKNVRAGLCRPERVRIPGQVTKTGRPKTRVVRVNQGNVPFGAIATFPYGVRIFRRSAASYYTGRRLPRGITLDKPSQEGPVTSD
jgi:hypothetical protein